MEILLHEINTIKIAEIISDEVLIRETHDALDLMADVGTRETWKIIIREKNLVPLKTILAGDILQKFSNWDFQLAIIGDFSKYKSNSLQNFINESNRGNRIFFVDNLETALLKLSVK
jgi:hypothetical protein